MLEDKILEEIIKDDLIENGDKIVVGVSGGPDSICLLDVFHKLSKKCGLQFEIFVAHVNHGLRENAIVDEEFVKNFCEKIEIPCFVKRANVRKVAEERKRGLEEAGRKVRYDFFDEVQRKIGANKIAIAHNMNDHAETILMNIFRGASPRGLVGIEKKVGKYIRPLLETKREEIEQYLAENKIVARHDESNDDNCYTRNKIRNVVLPYLQKEFNPSLVEALNRLSILAKEQEDYIEQEVVRCYQKICISEDIKNGEIILNLKEFNQLNEILQKRMILLAIQNLFGTTKGIEKIHMDAIMKLCHNNIGNKYLTPNKNVKIALQNKNLKIMKINI